MLCPTPGSMLSDLETAIAQQQLELSVCQRQLTVCPSRPVPLRTLRALYDLYTAGALCGNALCFMGSLIPRIPPTLHVCGIQFGGGARCPRPPPRRCFDLLPPCPPGVQGQPVAGYQGQTRATASPRQPPEGGGRHRIARCSAAGLRPGHRGL